MGNRVGGRCSPSPPPPLPPANDEPIQVQSTPRRKNVGILELGIRKRLVLNSLIQGRRTRFSFSRHFWLLYPSFLKREDTLSRLGSIRTSLRSNARPPFPRPP